MKTLMRLSLLTIAVAFCSCTCAAAQLGETLKKTDAALEHHDSSSLSDDEIVAGLKQALEIGTSKAISLTGKPDGFLDNEAIRILLPTKLQSVGKAMRLLGEGDTVDDLEIGMNRAAERATPQAKQIFLDALKKKATGAAIRPPVFLFTTADATPTFPDALVSWVVFYHQLPRVSLTDKKAVKEVLTRVKAAGATTLKYSRWDRVKHRYLQYTPGS